jgi:lipid-A-disaccharide synthase
MGRLERMSNPLRLLVVAGELSGDRYAAALVQEIKATTSCEILSIGGPLLKSVSDLFIGDCTAYTAVGLRSVINARPIFKVFDYMEWVVSDAPVDYAIIVDFPHYNFEIARRLNKKNIPIITMITPNFWIWNDQKSARKIAAYSTKIVTIFPPEHQLYQSIGATVGYFGNPLIDLVPPRTGRTRRPHLLDGTTAPIRVGLFPGSRLAELKLLLRKTLATASELSARSPRFEFILPIARDDFKAYVEREIHRNHHVCVSIVPPLSPGQMDEIDIAICATGTMTLELVLNRVPMVVLGALSPLSFWIATCILRIKISFCALPNLVAGWRVVPEFMQSAIRPTPVADAVCQLLRPADQEAQQQKYSEFIRILGGDSGQKIIPQIAQWILAHDSSGVAFNEPASGVSLENDTQ